MLQHRKYSIPPVLLTCHVGTGWYSGCSISDSCPTNIPVKSSKYGSSAWAPATPEAYLNKPLTPGS